MAPNPFSPSFGISPPVLAGRDDILDGFEEAIATGPSHPGYTTLLIGHRGTGKTALLNALEERARQRGWMIVSDNTSHPGLIDRIESAAATLFRQRGGRLRRASNRIRERLSRVWVFDLRPPPMPGGLRNVLTILGNAQRESGSGVLITIDELQSGDPADLRRFAAVLQHVTRREGLPVAFFGAALPRIEDSLLSDDAVTFIQRALRHQIGPLDKTATRKAIDQPIREQNGVIEPQGLEAAVQSTSGYPFMIQLVGYHSWEAASEPKTRITSTDVTAGIAQAQNQIGDLVIAPAWKALSPMDRRFLREMTKDEGESALADIASRLSRDLKYASAYRDRLIRANMIEATARGRVGFIHDAARQWIRRQASRSAGDGT